MRIKITENLRIVPEKLFADKTETAGAGTVGCRFSKYRVCFGSSRS